MKMKTLPPYCARLQCLRRQKNWPQHRSARALGISQSTYVKYENDRRRLPIALLYPLRELFVVSANYLLDFPTVPRQIHEK